MRIVLGAALAVWSLAATASVAASAAADLVGVKGGDVVKRVP
jgi:hypothetical protein